MFVTKYTPAESGHANGLRLGKTLLRVNDPHPKELLQQLLRHLYPKLVAGIQRLQRVRRAKDRVGVATIESVVLNRRKQAGSVARRVGANGYGLSTCKVPGRNKC